MSPAAHPEAGFSGWFVAARNFVGRASAPSCWHLPSGSIGGPNSQPTNASAAYDAQHHLSDSIREKLFSVFSHVRRTDVILAAVAALGLTAGLTLTIASKLGASGPAFIAVGIVTALAAAVRGLWGVAVPIGTRQQKQTDWLRAICRVRIAPISEVDPFNIGVFPSELAKREAGGRKVPPYTPRRVVDDALQQALAESSLNQNQRLVVLRGEPKSGKSRTMWEAVRTLEGRRLLALMPPAAGTEVE